MEEKESRGEAGKGGEDSEEKAWLGKSSTPTIWYNTELHRTNAELKGNQNRTEYIKSKIFEHWSSEWF